MRANERAPPMPTDAHRRRRCQLPLQSPPMPTADTPTTPTTTSSFLLLTKMPVPTTYPLPPPPGRLPLAVAAPAAYALPTRRHTAIACAAYEPLDSARCPGCSPVTLQIIVCSLFPYFCLYVRTCVCASDEAGARSCTSTRGVRIWKPGCACGHVFGVRGWYGPVSTRLSHARFLAANHALAVHRARLGAGARDSRD